jgi:hypothetical protein
MGDVDSTINKLILKLRNNELSRNRNFELFKNPAARRALQIHLLLRQLEKELTRLATSDSGKVAVEEHNGRVVIQIDDPSLRLRRSVYLSRDEVRLLLQEPAVARLFGRSVNEAD